MPKGNNHLMAKETVKSQDEEDDPWKTGTGMADDFDGYFQEPFFGVDEKYNAEAMLFCATLVDPEGEPVTTIKYSVGQGWDAEDDGSTISHPTKKVINNSSRFGFFIDRLAGGTDERSPKRKEVEAPKGENGNGLGLGKLLKSRGTPFEAKVFDGLGFHWKLHRMPTMGKDDNNQTIYKDVLLPTSYLGEYGGGGKAASKKGAAASKAAAKSEEAGDVEIPIKLRKKLTPLAQSSTAKEFTKAAGRDNDVLTLDDDVMSYIINPGPTGFWASTQE